MKKNILFFGVICSVAFIGCKWRIPEKVSVKTKAEYNFSVGTVEKDLSSYFSLKDVLASYFDEDSGTAIYDYNPNKNSANLQQFMFKMPIQKIGIDFSQYFNETNIAQSLDDMSFSKEVTIPDVGIEYNNTVSTSEMAKAVNALISVAGVTPGGAISFIGDFTSIKYSSGTLLINSTGDAISGTVTLKQGSTTISSASFTNGKATLSLDGKTITKSGMSLLFSDNTGKPFLGTVESSSQITLVKGITTTTPISIPIDGTITQSAEDGDITFISCTIGEGTLNTTVSIPNSWTNYELQYDLSLSGAMTLTSPNSSGKTKNIDLKDVDITSGDTTVNSNVQLSFTNSDINFEDSPSLLCTSDIKTLKRATVDLKTSQTNINESHALSSEMTTMIHSIDFAPSGIGGTFTNTFPAGNSIILEATSSFFGMSSVKQTLASATPTGDISLLGTEKTVVMASTPSIDFDAVIKLPGYDENHPTYVTVVNVEPESTYSISLALEPSINWTKITVNSGQMSKDGCISTGLNFNNIFGNENNTISSVFQGKLSFGSVPVYLYCEKPNLSCLESAKYHGSIEAFYGVGEGSSVPTRKTQYDPYAVKFLDNADMSFANVPTLERVTTENEDYVITDISKEKYSTKGDLAELMNNTLEEEQGCIYIDYDLSFSNGNGGSTFTITKEDFDKSHSQSSSIAIYAVLVFPFEFTLSDEVDINVLSLIGKDSGGDLFGRSELPTSDNIQEYLEVIEKVSLCYDLQKVPFTSKEPITFEINLDPAGGSIAPYSIPMQKGSIGVDPLVFMSIYPFQPTVNLHLPKAKVAITRDMGIKTAIVVRINTNGTKPIVDFSSSKGGK